MQNRFQQIKSLPGHLYARNYARFRSGARRLLGAYKSLLPLSAYLFPWVRRRTARRIGEIHAIVKEAFQTDFKQANVNARALLDELDKLKLGLNAQALEARAMLHMKTGTELPRMRLYMTQLQKLRRGNGEVEIHEAFLAFLKEHVPANRMFGHSYKSTTFAQRDHDQIWARVEEVMQELKDFTETVFLNSGTLLGVVRDQKLMDHDDDIDLAVMLKATNTEDAAREWQELRLRLIEAGMTAPRVGVDWTVPGMIKVFSKSKVNYGIDLFPAWIEKGKVYIFPYCFGDVPEGDVFPLAKCDVTGLPIPANPEALLAANYGEDWPIPDPFYVFPWGTAYVRFKRFMETLQDIRHKRVITYGTFDLFHVGHVRLLSRLSKMADEVIVACSTDEFNELKGKKTAVPYAQRVEMLNACKYVTKVVPERKWEQKRSDIKRLKADMFVIGDDWRGEFDDLSDICEVLYLPRTQDISTTMLKDDIRSGAGKADGAQKGVDGKARSPA